ncbi:MAG: hypothetical protein ACYS9X_28950, partial [Planctomycetota bacterium]
MNPEELPAPAPSPPRRIEGWKRTALLAATAVGSGVLARWILAPMPYPLGLRPPEWSALEPKLSPIVMRHLAAIVPWVAAACLAAVLMPRRKWLWAIGCAVGAALAYHFRGGAILRVALPSLADLDIRADDPMERMLALESMFRNPMSFAPSWEIVLIGAAYEVPFALVSGPAGAALAFAGMKLKDARQATQVAVGASVVVVLASAALVLQWIDRPPRRAADAAPGPVVEMRLVHDEPEAKLGLRTSFSVPLAPGAETKRVPTQLPPREIAKMRLPDDGPV